MTTRPTVLLQCAKFQNLNSTQRRFFEAVAKEITEIGLDLAPPLNPSADLNQRFEQLSQSQGLLAIAFAQWEGERVTREQSNPCVFTSEFVHISVALAMAARCPVLLLREKSLAERGVLRRGYVRQSLDMPKSLDIGWLESRDFQNEFKEWVRKVKEYKDVFLGYSSNAREIAAKIREFLTTKVGVSVFDWYEPKAGEAIWELVSRAEQYTRCGVFCSWEMIPSLRGTNTV